MNLNRLLYLGSVASLTALIFLCLAWELWLAPIRPGGSWLVLKVVFLLFPLFGILRSKVYTYQWSSMFILIYFTEGVVRGWSDRGLSQTLALAEVALSMLFFVCVIYYARAMKRLAAGL